MCGRVKPRLGRTGTFVTLRDEQGSLRELAEPQAEADATAAVDSIQLDLGSAQIDLRKLLTTRLLVTAASGFGKSYLLRRLMEEAAPHVQLIVLDVDGEFASLRELPIPFIYCAVGEKIQPRMETAADLALEVRRSRASIILDLYDLEQEAKVEFSARFLKALLDAPREFYSAALVVVDECHVLAPQRGFAVPKGQPCSKKAVEGIACRGRKRGLGLIAATQRLSKLNKDVCSELLSQLFGRVALRNDVGIAADQLGLSAKETRKLLGKLEPGTFFGYGPALTTEVSKLVVGPVRTTHGTAATRVMRPPVLDIKDAQARLEEMDSEAERQQQLLSAATVATPKPVERPRVQTAPARERSKKRVSEAAKRRLCKTIHPLSGAERAAQILRLADEHGVSRSAIYVWLKKYPKTKRLYLRKGDVRREKLVNQVLSLPLAKRDRTIRAGAARLKVSPVNVRRWVREGSRAGSKNVARRRRS